MRVFAVLAMLLLVSPLWAAGVRLGYDMGGGAVVRIVKDSAGVVQVDGLQYPGLILYKPDTQVVYYQHPASPDWLLITPQAMSAHVVSASALPGAPWQPYMDAPTRRWEVKADGKGCGNWFSSAKAGVMAGLNVGDMLRIVNAVRWLNEGTSTVPCERLAVGDDLGKGVGLPIFMDTPSGPWHLTEFSAVEVAPLALPDTPVPVTDAVRVQILLSQLAYPEREAFIKTHTAVPLAAQLEALEARLKSAFRD